MDGVKNWWILPLTHHCNIPNLSVGHKKHTHRFKFKYLSWILYLRFVAAISQSVLKVMAMNQPIKMIQIFETTLCNKRQRRSQKIWLKYLVITIKIVIKSINSETKFEIPKKSIPFSVVHRDPTLQSLHYGGKGIYRTVYSLINQSS